MDSGVIATIVSAIASIICAIVAGLFAREKKGQTEIEKRADELEARRAEEAKLQLKMINANSKLTVGVAKALKNGHCNGEVEEGLHAVQEVDADYTQFLEEIALGTLRK